MRLTLSLAILFTTLAASQDKPPSCKKYLETPLPVGDVPPPVSAEVARKCDSNSLYYGFEKAAKPVEARKCAYWERSADGFNSPFHGSAILMMIYANGQGAKRNLDLALRFACEGQDGDAEAEVFGRVAHLEKMKSEASPANFDFCEDLTSGYLQGFCATQTARLDEVARNRRLNSILGQWSGGDKHDFETLRKIASSFFEERIHNEVDLSGSARGAFMVAEDTKLQDDLVAAIASFERGKLPAFSQAAFAKIDATLNAVYALALTSISPDFGTVTPEGVRKTQRAWIRYRNAWVAFGTNKYPTTSAESWKSWITQQRIKQLQDLANH